MKKTNVILRTVANLAKGTAERSINTTCVYVSYQPKLPDSAKKLRKF